MVKGTMKVGFLIFPGFPMACMTSMIEPLRAANEISGTTCFAWQLVAETEGRVRSSAEVTFDPSCCLKDVAGLDFLILLSAPTAVFQNPKSMHQLRALSRHGVTLGAVSGGVFPLMRSGLVGSDTVSVHWCYEAAFKAEFADQPASDQVIEVGPRIVTASGAAAAFDLALHMVEVNLGEPVATEVACWFQHPMMRKSGVRQTVPVMRTDFTEADLPPLVAKAVSLAAQNLAEPISVAELAAMMGVSPRQVERNFKKATGQNPTTYLRMMRMKAARQIVLYSNDRLADVALAVGYATPKSFTQSYRAAFGVSPKEDRARINLYRSEGNIPLPTT